jgi:hypothetical protein
VYGMTEEFCSAFHEASVHPLEITAPLGVTELNGCKPIAAVESGFNRICRLSERQQFIRQHPIHESDRQPDHVRVGPFDSRHEPGRQSLHRVGAGLVHRLAA